VLLLLHSHPPNLARKLEPKLAGSPKKWRSEGDIVFSSVCLFIFMSVCLFVNTITPELLVISSQNIQGIILWSKGRTSSKMAI